MGEQMLDTSNWKCFKFRDLDPSITKGFAYTKEQLTFISPCDKSVPFVTRTENNNCVDGFVLDNGLKVENGNAITIGDTTATVSYQQTPFVCGDHIAVIRADWMNERRGLFLTALLRKEKYRYCYGRAFVIDSILETTIKLPAIQKGSVDWDWIDSYMNSFELSLPCSVNPQKNNKMDTSCWKEFTIGSVFELETGKVSKAGDLPDGNDVFYIGAKKEGNGIMGKVGNVSGLESKGNCLVFICDGQGSVGYVNYMDQDFLGTVNLTLGYSKNLNQYSGLFIATVASLERPRYSYGRKWRGKVGETKIKLPAIKGLDEIFRPDWLYMENYIKSLRYGDCL